LNDSCWDGSSLDQPYLDKPICHTTTIVAFCRLQRFLEVHIPLQPQCRAHLVLTCPAGRAPQQTPSTAQGTF
jgi:hypothetical protein